MAGIGDYEEGKPFSLKSGNKPTFKNMGSSPNNYGTPGNMPIDNFGLVPGDSPYTQKEGETKEEKSDTTILDPTEGGDSGWKKALKIGVAGLTGGLDAVYGTGKVVPMVSHVKKTKEVEDNPVSTEIKENIKKTTGLDTDTEETSYKVQGGDSLSKIAKANNMTLEELLEKNPDYKENPNVVKSGATLNL